MKDEIDLYRRRHDWMATPAGKKDIAAIGKDPEEAVGVLQTRFPALKGSEINYKGVA